jgi:hypothetical protein
LAENDWTDALPRTLKLRFEGIGNYVAAVLEEGELRRPLSRDAVRQIQLVAFVKSLDEFLRDGTDAAVHAVDEFRSLGVERFRIGSEEFEGRNEAVMRGARLSERLRSSVGDDSLQRFIAMDRPLRDVILSMARILSGRRLG